MFLFVQAYFFFSCMNNSSLEVCGRCLNKQTEWTYLSHMAFDDDMLYKLKEDTSENRLLNEFFAKWQHLLLVPK